MRKPQGRSIVGMLEVGRKVLETRNMVYTCFLSSTLPGTVQNTEKMPTKDFLSGRVQELTSTSLIAYLWVGKGRRLCGRYLWTE